MGARPGRRDRPIGTGRTPPPSQPQVLGGTTETENSEELPRYTLSDDTYLKIHKCFHLIIHLSVLNN